MQRTDTASTNGRPSPPVGGAARHSELEQRRATCARQALAIERLNEDVAMFRRAVVALTAQHPRPRRGRPREPRGFGAGAVNEERFALDAHAPAAARAGVRGRLRDCISASVLETAELLVSELVTNSVRHSAVAPGDGVVVVVRVLLEKTVCRLEVEDPGRAGVVAPRPPDLQSGGGMGLNLVQSLSERWGVERVAKGGTRVWAQLALVPVADAALAPERNGNHADRLHRAPTDPRASDRRDQLAEARDQAAAARDEIAERREAELATRNGDGFRAAVQAAAEDRRRAAADRRQAAADRAQARHDRLHADHDQLTGAMARDAGLRAIEHEIARARRTGDPLTLAFVDVDKLKRVNDAHGHAVGDTLLRNVVEALRSGLRETDLIVRYGGDEFLCALAGATKKNAAKRLAVSEDVLAGFATGSLSVGLADLRAGDDTAALIARADRALYAGRGQPLTTS